MERFIESETNSLGVGGLSSLVDTSDKKTQMFRTIYYNEKGNLPGWLI